MSWLAALAIFLLGGLVGFAIAAVLGAGAREEAEREAAYWRQQAQVWLLELGELRRTVDYYRAVAEDAREQFNSLLNDNRYNQ